MPPLLLRKSLITIFLVLLFDQLLKFWIKTHMTLGEEIPIFGNWFLLHFTENRGMAFGMEFGGTFGKLFLSLFRIVAVVFIGYYLWILIRRGAKSGLIVCLSLILAGALGNIIDSAFYGMIFNESYYQVATLFPREGAYGTFLHGKVVDMLYFPIIQTTWPSWVPIWGGQDFQFFRPVFNIADSSISVGVISLIFFQKNFLGHEKSTENEAPEEEGTEKLTEESTN